jgi:hypothetical protein
MDEQRTIDQDKLEQSELDVEAQARREFLKRVGTVGATAPAVALLLAANAKSSSACSHYGGGCQTGGCGCGGCGCGGSRFRR